MASCIIEITDSAIKNNRMDIAACGPDFFPKDAIVGPNRNSKLGLAVNLYSPFKGPRHAP
jgi:hypothetical protein